MPLILHTNLPSLQAQRQLNDSQNALQTSLRRISSGLRINSAKDDAAGLAISESFSTQIRGLKQASRNASDAISLAQVGDGALETINNNLQRIRELALQALNGSNSAEDRKALNLEVHQRVLEIDRIAKSSSFNGKKLLDGSFGSAYFHIGTKSNESLILDISSGVRVTSIGAIAEARSVDLGTIIGSGAGTSGFITTGTIADFDFSSTVSVLAATSLGAFTEGEDIDLINDYFHLFIVIPGVQRDVVVNNLDTTASPTAVADALAAEFVVQGFANDGSGVVSGFSLDTGGEATIAEAISNGTLNVFRPDDFGFGYFSGSAGYSTQTPQFLLGNAAISSPTAITDDSNNRTLAIDGYNIVLAGSTENDAVNQLQSQLDSQALGEYSIAGNGGGNITILKTATGASSTAPVITGTDARLFTSGSTASNGTDGAGQIIVADDFQLQFGSNTPVSVENGIYQSSEDLLAAVNDAISNQGDALINSDGSMSILSQQEIAVTGTTGLTTLGLAALTPVTGSLATVKINTVENAQQALYKVDKSLSEVSALRATIGSLQNRLQSVINFQTTAHENLSAARSRIQDTDYAQETAIVSRQLILQEAGISIVALASTSPRNVLHLS